MSFEDFSVQQDKQWSSRYQSVGEEYLFGTEPNRFLASQVGLFRVGETVLSVADGEGRNSVWLASQGCRVSALELSEVAVTKARRLAQRQKVEVDFCIGDMGSAADCWRNPNTPRQFDWVVGIFIQFAPPELRRHQFAQIRSLVKPGGRVLLQGYTPKQLEYRTGGPAALENLYTASLLREAWQGWSIEYLEEYEDNLTEGTGHHGRSALIGMIARCPEA
jgi:Thiopurine S-methyltransferase (TPMT).